MNKKFMLLTVILTFSNVISAAQLGYLGETALICRTPQQVHDFLTDLEMNKTPNFNVCALNPMKQKIQVKLGNITTVGGDKMIQWTLPSGKMTGWTLESNVYY